MTKKKIFFLLIILNFLPVVYALDLDYSVLLLITPLVLIVISLLIFIIMIVKDRLAMKSLAMPTFDNVAKKGLGGEKKLGGKETKEEIGYYVEIEDLEEKLNTLNTESACKELMRIVRRFFADYLNINYEFTYEELEEELKEKKKNIAFFSKNLAKIEYSPNPISKSALIKMMDEFKGVIKIIQNQTRASSDFSKDVNKIKDLTNKGKKVSRRDLSSAINLYKDVYFLYHKLPSKEKRKVHDSIKEFYELIA